MNYECSTPTGCGSNDNCNFDENCIKDRLASGGYRCQGMNILDFVKFHYYPVITRTRVFLSNYLYIKILASSWADVPNWPLMSINNDADVTNKHGDSGKDKDLTSRYSKNGLNA